MDKKKKKRTMVMMVTMMMMDGYISGVFYFSCSGQGRGMEK
jgi:hypothetical protein